QLTPAGWGEKGAPGHPRRWSSIWPTPSSPPHRLPQVVSRERYSPIPCGLSTASHPLRTAPRLPYLHRGGGVMASPYRSYAEFWAVLSSRAQQPVNPRAALCRHDRLGGSAGVGAGDPELVVADRRAGVRLRLRLVCPFLRRKEQAGNFQRAAVVPGQRLSHVRAVPGRPARSRIDEASDPP